LIVANQDVQPDSSGTLPLTDANPIVHPVKYGIRYKISVLLPAVVAAAVAAVAAVAAAAAAVAAVAAAAVAAHARGGATCSGSC
jgi:hypothetical protein